MNTEYQIAEYDTNKAELCGNAPKQACLGVGNEIPESSELGNNLQGPKCGRQQVALLVSSESEADCTWYEVATQCLSAGLWMGLLVFAPLMAGIALY